MADPADLGDDELRAAASGLLVSALGFIVLAVLIGAVAVWVLVLLSTFVPFRS